MGMDLKKGAVTTETAWGSPLPERTEDGSSTLFLPELDEHYHSVKGAVAEARCVYIESGLHAIARRSVSVFEMGFGTGLNAFLSLLDAEQRGVSIRYTAIERFPLPETTVSSLGYATLGGETGVSLFTALHRAPWDTLVPITPRFSLRKLKGDLLSASWTSLYDVVFYDAFAPEKQPELWEEPVFRKLFDAMLPGGVLTTYCAKGEVRRRLQRVGFTVERLPGPPGGKREILRARR